MDCLGCRIVKKLELNVHTIYENEHVVCVLDIDQQSLAAITDVTVMISKF